ncbi:MAG: hypothetical protein MZV64_29930 [Ignavibacteriales bacterium]|nr:hypothetical protein [Ignavibacteriales bacterium]
MNVRTSGESAEVERDVYIYSAPKVRIRDFFANATLDNVYINGVLNLDVDIVNNTEGMRSGNYEVEYRLYDRDQKIVLSSAKTVPINKKAEIRG